MTTVYIVTHGEYSDYWIVGAFSTEEKAQEYIDAFKNNKQRNYMYGDFNEIEEYDLDELDKCTIMTKQGNKFYCVYMYRNGDAEVSDKYPEPIDEFELIKPPKGMYADNRWYIRLTLWAKSPEHAVKIVNEKRAQLIANGEWDE